MCGPDACAGDRQLEPCLGREPALTGGNPFAPTGSKPGTLRPNRSSNRGTLRPNRSSNRGTPSPQPEL
jgi:hypothetical protein